jgi:hypothetical protein
MLLRTPRAVALAAALLLTPTAALAATAPTDGAGGASMLLLPGWSNTLPLP